MTNISEAGVVNADSSSSKKEVSEFQANWATVEDILESTLDADSFQQQIDQFRAQDTKYLVALAAQLSTTNESRAKLVIDRLFLLAQSEVYAMPRLGLQDLIPSTSPRTRKNYLEVSPAIEEYASQKYQELTNGIPESLPTVEAD